MMTPQMLTLQLRRGLRAPSLALCLVALLGSAGCSGSVDEPEVSAPPLNGTTGGRSNGTSSRDTSTVREDDADPIGAVGDTGSRDTERDTDSIDDLDNERTSNSGGGGSRRRNNRDDDEEVEVDAGIEADAGIEVDAGVVEVDAGVVEVDAGVVEADAGVL